MKNTCILITDLRNDRIVSSAGISPEQDQKKSLHIPGERDEDLLYRTGT